MVAATAMFLPKGFRVYIFLPTGFRVYIFLPTGFRVYMFLPTGFRVYIFLPTGFAVLFSQQLCSHFVFATGCRTARARAPC